MPDQRTDSPTPPAGETDLVAAALQQIESFLPRSFGACDEDRIRRFVQDWESGKRRDIEFYLPPAKDPRYVTTLKTLIRIEVELSWRAYAELRREADLAGDERVLPRPKRVEEIADRLGLDDDEALWWFVQLEYHVRCRFAERPGVLEYRVRFSRFRVTEAKLAESVDSFLPLPAVQSFGSPTFTPSALSPTRLGADAADEPDLTLTYLAIRRDGTVDGIRPSGETQSGAFAAGIVLNDRYRLEREIGRGGMGVVFLARDERLHREVAIKTVLSKQRDGADLPSRQALFESEARLGANLSHPAIAAVFDYGFFESQPFTVFEYVPGQSLRDWLKLRGRVPLEEAQLFLGPVAQALDFAHSRRVLHRDLKPENIRVTPQGQFKILDLGLAREFDRHDEWQFAGTVAYASPEQAAELPSDGRADQYALALIVFEMLTGRRPFAARHPLALLKEHIQGTPPDPRGLAPGLPDTAARALLQALSKDPQARFDSCQEFATAMGCRYLTQPAERPVVLLEARVPPESERFRPQVGKRHLALTQRSLWTLHDDAAREYPIEALKSVRRSWSGKVLETTWRSAPGVQSLEFRFHRRRDCRLWFEQLRRLQAERHQQPPAIHGDSPAGRATRRPLLLRHKPNVRYQVLGIVQSEQSRRRHAETSLQLQAAMIGADAVLDVTAEKTPAFGASRRLTTGVAVRTADPRANALLHARWFSERIERYGTRMIWMGVLVLAGLSVFNLFHAALLEIRYRTLMVVAALVYFWPMLVGIVLRWLKWPELVPSAVVTFRAWALAPWAGRVLALLFAVPLVDGPVTLLLLALGLVLDPLQWSVTAFSLLQAQEAEHALDRFRAAELRDGPELVTTRSRIGAAAFVPAVIFAVVVTLGQVAGAFAAYFPRWR